MAMSFSFLAILGRFSLILMPVTEVAISLVPPPFLWSVLTSKVSYWLGPPAIHNRMHERLRCGMGAAASARRPNQPDDRVVNAPAADRVSHSRRERIGAAIRGCLLVL